MSNFKSTFLENYTIFPSEFDQGGFGNIYKVSFKKTPQDDKIYIVKLVEPDEDKSSLERAQKEVEVTKKLQHENIITIFESWVEFPPVLFQYPYRPIVFNPDGVLFIRMEFGDLRSLKKWLDLATKTLEEARILMYQICQGLAYLHSQSVVHRDLKPANIVLKTERDGSVVAKIVDFGLATELRSRMTSRLGTKYYISPEVTKPGGKYTEKADVYSLGIIFSQMIAYSQSGQCPQKCDDHFIQFMKDGEDALGIPKPFQVQNYFSVYPENTLTLQENELLMQMTTENVSKRISSEQVIKSIKKIHPESQDKKIPAYKYSENPTEYSQTGTENAEIWLKIISPQQANTLTKLTLSYVKISDIDDLCEILQSCHVLNYLHLTINLCTVHLCYRAVQLPLLKTFYLHQLNQDFNYNFDEFMNERKLKNMMFFGPLEQILENQMNVTVIYGEEKLVDIDIENGTFFLFGTCGHALIPILKQHKFFTISLHKLINYVTRNSKYYTSKIDLQEIPSSNCEKLKIFDVPIDVKNGKLFAQHFQYLTELKYEAVAHTTMQEIFALKYISETIRRLHLGNLTIRLDTRRKMNLEYFSMDACIIPQEFEDNYPNLFEVEEIRIITPNCPSGVTPNFNLVEKIYETEWKVMQFATFNWEITETNTNFAEYLIPELKMNRIHLNCPTFQMKMTDGEFSAQEMTYAELYGEQKSFPSLESTNCTDMVIYSRLPTENSPDDLKSAFFDGFINNTVTEFPNFGGIPGDPNEIEKIHIKNVIIKGNSFLVQLKRYKKAKIMILENIQLQENFTLKSDFPNLKTFKFLYNEGFLKLRQVEATKYFTKDKLLSFLLFSRNGFKSLWSSGMNIYISSNKHKVLELVSDEITIQFLDFAEEILQQVGMNDKLKSLVLHRVKCSISILPSHLTRLNLTHVTGIKFQEIFDPLVKFPNLKELFFDAIETDIEQEVELTIIQNHPSLETLMIGGVTIIKLAEITLDTFTICNCILPLGFEEDYAQMFNVKHFVLIGAKHYIPFFKTMLPLFKTDHLLTWVMFYFYAVSFEVIEKCLKDRFSLEWSEEMVIEGQEVRDFFVKCNLYSGATAFKLFRKSTRDNQWTSETPLVPELFGPSWVEKYTGRYKLSDYERFGSK